MNKATEKKITALAARHGWHLTQQAAGGLHLYEATPENSQERDAILRVLDRCKGLTVETWNPYCAHSFVCVIRIYEAAELDAWRRLQAQYIDLTDLFCQIVHDGGTQEQAKAAQLRFAQETDAMEAYNMLYA